MLHKTLFFDTSPDRHSLLTMCHASLCQQVLFLRANQMASGISSHLFSCVPCVSFFAEGRHFNIPLNSINDEEHTKVQSVGCTKKVTSNLLHGCPASALLLPKGNFYLLWYQADFQLCHQTGTPQLISTIVAYKEGNT